MEFKENQICPKCGEYMLMMYGCGWDYDRLICGDRAWYPDWETKRYC